MIDYNNKNLRPKTFYAKIERDRNGEFTVKKVNVLDRTNQHAKNLRRVDARDFTRAIRKNGIQVA